ncbi:hypothetical protein J6590_020821 [Homalodisca vitripennis]|nr:hypothetical protein J6590_020821 [Homalodisca vitripennis]
MLADTIPKHGGATEPSTHKATMWGRADSILGVSDVETMLGVSFLSSSFFVADCFWIPSDDHDFRFQESSLQQHQISDAERAKFYIRIESALPTIAALSVEDTAAPPCNSSLLKKTPNANTEKKYCNKLKFLITLELLFLFTGLSLFLFDCLFPRYLEDELVNELETPSCPRDTLKNISYAATYLKFCMQPQRCLLRGMYRGVLLPSTKFHSTNRLVPSLRYATVINFTPGIWNPRSSEVLQQDRNSIILLGNIREWRFFYITLDFDWITRQSIFVA